MMARREARRNDKTGARIGAKEREAGANAQASRYIMALTGDKSKGRNGRSSSSRLHLLMSPSSLGIASMNQWEKSLSVTRLQQ